MLTLLKRKFISLIQLILVLIYIIFEELIWEGISKPIYKAIHSLKILQKLENKLETVKPSVVLALFVFLLIIVEGAGIYAGMLFVSGHVLLGLGLYISKIPIAAFTFWLFRVTESKLMQFAWFKWLYEKILAGIAWLKATEAYKRTMIRLTKTKESLKAWKDKYIGTQDNAFFDKMKKLYDSLKDSLKK